VSVRRIALGYVVWAGGLGGLALAYHHVPEGMDSVWGLTPQRELLSVGPPWSLGLFLALAVASLAGAWVGYRLLAAEDSLRRLTCGVALVGVVLAFAFPPLLSDDVFSYADIGLALRSGANPYVTPPAETPVNPVRPFNSWAPITAPYGPLWLLTSALVVGGGGDAGSIALRFKLFGAATLVAAALIAARIAGPGAARTLATNPVVVIEAAATGHVDIFLTLLALSAALAFSRRRLSAAAILLGLAVSCKLTVGLLVPLLVLRARGWGDGLRLSALTGGVALLTYAPFMATGGVLAPFRSTINEGGRGLTNFFWGAPRILLEAVLPTDEVDSAVFVIFLATVLVATFAVSIAVYRTTRSGKWSPGFDLARWAGVEALLALTARRSFTWYWILPVGLAAAAEPRGRLLRFAIVCFTVAMSLVYVVLVPAHG
jgi:hypothetical protein